jgi:hypothetical protein
LANINDDNSDKKMVVPPIDYRYLQLIPKRIIRLNLKFWQQKKNYCPQKVEEEGEETSSKGLDLHWMSSESLHLSS